MLLTSDQRMLELAELLKKDGRISTDKEFCEAVCIDRGNFAKIRSGNKYSAQNYHFTAKHIEAACRIFSIDANWIFGLSDNLWQKRRVTQPVTLNSDQP